MNETSDGKRGFISNNSADGPLILRGAAISLYVLREASQGTLIYLRKSHFLDGKPESEKAKHHLQSRVGWQESSAQNNFRRIIAAAIPKGHFCNHKINYIPEKASKLPLDFVLALLNSKIGDWFFRLSSTSAAVSHYQVLQLPVPTISSANPPNWWSNAVTDADWARVANCSPVEMPGRMPDYALQAIVLMCRRIAKQESARRMRNRSDRSHLAEESQVIQNAIDRLFFRYFGLTDEDASYICGRLAEML